MHDISHYHSPIGHITLIADEIGLSALILEGHTTHATSPTPPQEHELSALSAAKRWLDQYFSGRIPDFTPPLHLTGTPFQMEVWAILSSIPHGKAVTYGEIAAVLAERRGKPMSAQAVGGAVGRNPIAIIVPCHRVLGAGGRLTGYAGGIGKKIALLTIENIPFTE